MIFVRRTRGPGRYTAFRVGLFFLAAGIWLAGVRVADERVTSVAIAVAAVAILIGAVGRMQARREEAAVASEAEANEE